MLLCRIHSFIVVVVLLLAHFICCLCGDPFLCFPCLSSVLSSMVGRHTTSDIASAVATGSTTPCILKRGRRRHREVSRLYHHSMSGCGREESLLHCHSIFRATMSACFFVYLLSYSWCLMCSQYYQCSLPHYILCSCVCPSYNSAFVCEGL